MAILTPEQQQAFSRRRLGIESEADIARKRIGEDFDVTGRLLADQRDEGVKDTGHQIASQGLWNSGIRINEQGRIVKNYNEELADLSLQTTRGREDVDRGLARGLADLDNQQATALAEANRSEQAANENRAMLEAIANAQTVAPPAYPNPVINISTPSYQPQPQQASYPVARTSTEQVGAFGLGGGLPEYTPPRMGGAYPNWPSFVQANPYLAEWFMVITGRDEKKAMEQAQNDGYVLRQSSRPVAGGRS